MLLGEQPKTCTFIVKPSIKQANLKWADQNTPPYRVNVRTAGALSIYRRHERHDLRFAPILAESNKTLRFNFGM